MKSVQRLEAILNGLKGVSDKEPLSVTITWRKIAVSDGDMYTDHLVPDVQITYKDDPSVSGIWQMGAS